MRFLDFKKQFADFNSISLQDIRNYYNEVNPTQISLWKKKDYLKSVKRGIYVLSDTDVDPFLLSNELNDSYISMEAALSHHQMIPEAVWMITCISNYRNEKIENDFGNFRYYKIAPKLFCGFVLEQSPVKEKRYFRIAEREKALFDLVYFRSDLKNYDDFDSLRLNIEKVNMRRLKSFIKLVEAPQIRNRLDNLIKYLNDIT